MKIDADADELHEIKSNYSNLFNQKQQATNQQTN